MNINYPSKNGKLHLIPSEVIAAEMLNAMSDEAMIEVYRWLVELKQYDAAELLAEYARRIADLDVSSGQPLSS